MKTTIRLYKKVGQIKKQKQQWKWCSNVINVHNLAYRKMYNEKYIILFAAKDGEALYSQQQKDWELTVAQIMNSLVPNSDLNWGK